MSTFKRLLQAIIALPLGLVLFPLVGLLGGMALAFSFAAEVFSDGLSADSLKEELLGTKDIEVL
jgi:hypothetical protein